MVDGAKWLLVKNGDDEDRDCKIQSVMQTPPGFVVMAVRKGKVEAGEKSMRNG
jgi:hypothetical protein